MGGTDAKKQILVVDGDKAQLSGAAADLKDDYDVTTVTASKGAENGLSQGLAPDLVLLDCFETYDKIRALDSMRNVPVIFLTETNSPEEVKKALASGAADYITKPYALENFMNRVKNAIQMYESKRR